MLNLSYRGRYEGDVDEALDFAIPDFAQRIVALARTTLAFTSAEETNQNML